jgi:hypothetical protein
MVNLGRELRLKAGGRHDFPVTQRLDLLQNNSGEVAQEAVAASNRVTVLCQRARYFLDQHKGSLQLGGEEFTTPEAVETSIVAWATKSTRNESLVQAKGRRRPRYGFHPSVSEEPNPHSIATLKSEMQQRFEDVGLPLDMGMKRAS